MFFTRVLQNLTGWNWSQIFARLQKGTAYLPVFLVPWIFSPISSNPFYVEKVLSILIFSSLSLFFYSAKYFFVEKNKQNGKSLKKLSSDRNNIFTFFTSSVQKFTIVLFIWFVLSQIFSINFNQSFWGVGTLLIFSLLIFSISIYQVYDRNLIKAILLIGIGFLAAINMLVVITRFSGSGFLEIVNIKSFSANGDVLSLIFILFVGVYLAFYDKENFLQKSDASELNKNKIQNREIKKTSSEIKINIFNQLKTISLFVIIFAYVFYAYFLNIYLIAYAFLLTLIIIKFVPKNGIERIRNFKNIFKKTITTNSESSNRIGKKKDKNNSDNKDKISLPYLTKITLTLVAISLGIFEIFLQKDFITPSRDFLPIHFSWQILFKSLTDNVKNFVVGVGSNNFSYTFLHYKPDGINQSQYWGNTYSASSQSIFEIISSLGISIPVLLILYFIVKYFRSVKENRKKFDFAKLSIDLMIIILFLITPLTVATFSILFFLFVIHFETVKKHELLLLHNFPLTPNAKNGFDSSLNIIRYFSFSFVTMFTLIIIIFSSYFYISSTYTKLGFFQKSITKTSNGVNIFPYYPDTLNTALNLSSEISIDQQNLNSNYFVSFGNKIITQNPYDPQAYISYLTFLNFNDANLSLSVDNYLRLISVSPNHIPFYLNLSDILVKESRYTDASQVLDKSISMSPNLDITLIKRANVYYLLADINSAETYIKRVKEVSQNQFVIKAADELQQKIDSLNSSKK